MKKTHIILSILTVLAICLFVSYPEIYTKTLLEGLKIWFYCVLPAVFPFFFLTTFLTKLGAVNGIAEKSDKLARKIFRCGGISVYVFFISILSGYPVGAKLINELHKQNKITTAEATRMSAFCSTSGPLFIIAAVGVSMLFDKKLGLLIFAAHVLSAVLSGIIFRNYKKREPISQNNFSAPLGTSYDNILGESVYAAVISIITVGGYVSLFYCFAEMLFSLLPPIQNLYVSGFLQGVVEITRGSMFLAANIDKTAAACLICALVSLGGVSINAQAIAYLSECKVNIKVYLLSKALQCVISGIICCLFLSIF